MFFTTPAISWMNYIGGGWEAEGWQYHSQGDKQQCCVFSRALYIYKGTETATVNLGPRHVQSSAAAAV